MVKKFLFVQGKKCVRRVKAWILHEVISERCISDKLNTFSSQEGTCSTYRYPFVMKKVFNWSELHLS